MQVTSIWPCILLCAGFVGLGAWIGILSPFYRELTLSKGLGKIETLDGLRAFLALGVFFHHGVITYYWMATGFWDFPPSTFYRVLGPYAVSLFFMITGFLFWTKAIRRSDSIRPRKLFVGRVLRIGPMYLLVSALVYGTILIESRFHLSVPLSQLAIGLASPLTLGVFKWRPINGVNPLTLNAEVNWTLQYEWAFYALLPLLAILATPRRFLGLCFVMAAVIPWASNTIDYWHALNFLAGMAAAQSIEAFGPIRLLSRQVMGVASVTLLGLFVGYPVFGYRTEKVMTVVALFLVFLCVSHGNTLLGTLTTRGARLLGTVSYSFYLLHGFVLYLGRSLLGRWLGGEPPTPAMFWAFMAGCGAVTIVASSLSYRYVEHPFIVLSHRLARRKNRPAPHPLVVEQAAEPAKA